MLAIFVFKTVLRARQMLGIFRVKNVLLATQMLAILRVQKVILANAEKDFSSACGWAFSRRHCLCSKLFFSRRKCLEIFVSKNASSDGPCFSCVPEQSFRGFLPSDKQVVPQSCFEDSGGSQ